MRQKLKVLTVVGTRPEIIRLSRVIAAMDKHFEHILVHTGQNYDYELNEIFFSELNIRKPDYFLNAAGNSAAETIGNTVSKIDPILADVNPQALLVLGDTNSPAPRLQSAAATRCASRPESGPGPESGEPSHPATPYRAARREPAGRSSPRTGRRSCCRQRRPGQAARPRPG